MVVLVWRTLEGSIDPDPVDPGDMLEDIRMRQDHWSVIVPFPLAVPENCLNTRHRIQSEPGDDES